MATEALGQATAAEDRRAWYGQLALGALRRAGAVLGRVFGVVRPVAWVLFAGALALWIAGRSLGWWELTVAAISIAVVLLLCLLFLIGRTAYDVSLDLNRTRVVVGERAVGALTLANTG